jgi:purine-binding chemotaxis protein CheW
MKNKKQVSARGEPNAIDWPEVHRRLRETRAATDEALSPSAESKKRILRARAQRLAQESVEEVAREILEVVELFVAQERYGIESAYVCEVYPLKEITRLPGTPPFVLGIVNVRGRVVSVVDLRRLFDLPPTETIESSKLIIIRDDTMEFGILADAVNGVHPIPLLEIKPSLPTLSSVRAEYVRGVTKDGMVLLEAGALLSDKKLIVHEEVEA